MGFLPALAPYLTVILLVLSNVFMTFAWYGHLKYPNAPMLVAIFGAWMVALIEYCLAVPANRIGHAYYSTAELKTIQEVITLIVFAGFSVFFLGEKLTIYHGIGFAFIAMGAAIIFYGPKLAGA